MPHMPRSASDAIGLSDGRLTPKQVRLLERHMSRVPQGHSLADTVAMALRSAILEGSLPPRMPLNEQDVASAFGVSRTPVREALRKLDAEELTIYTPGMSRVVASMSVDDVLAVYLVREVLEGLAARIAATRATSEDITALKQANEEFASVAENGTTDKATELNLKFHRLVRMSAQNAYLDRFLVQVENAVRRIPHSTFEYPGRKEVAYSEHNALIDAIANHDPEQAERLAALHMRSARERRVRSLLE
jgi:DNA-binding GntR family transcriptional regulator